MTSPFTPRTNGRALSLTPGARVLHQQNATPLSDEAIWKRLKEAGFDEESIKRRDKAALIAYIAKLESEIFDLQHNMGLLLLERKELAAKYEQAKASSEAAELKQKHDQAAHASAMTEAKKREESLKKTLGVEKECIASMEKAMHEMRAESAESKVAAECKMVEARNMMEEAQKKFLDAEAKMRAAESLQAEARRHDRAAERKLREVEALEEEFSRRTSTFKADCDAKEKELDVERQSLSETRKILQQEQDQLLERQALLNQREDYIASKSQELTRREKELEASKDSNEKQLRALNEEKSSLELARDLLSRREEAVIEREVQLNKREQDLLLSQEKLARKNSAEVQKVVANQEVALRARKTEFEAELEMKRNLVEDEIDAKRRSWELKEVDINQRENILLEKEHDLEVQSKALLEKENDLTEKMNILNDKERRLSEAERENELARALLLKGKEETNKLKLDLQRSSDSLEDEKKQVDSAKETLETLKSETNELSVFEMKLKEEVDNVRTQNLELMAEEQRLRIEKAKFEAEWELIDEKRQELLKEAELVAQEKEAVSRLLKDERDSLRMQKEAMWSQHKNNTETLNLEREEFMNKMMQERSEWFNKIQQERADFLSSFEMQKAELESSINKRREEIESYLKDKEEAFELEKKNELQHIGSLKEKAMKELDQVAKEMKKLEAERKEINSDREERERECAVINKSIEELKGQTLKLEKQRQLLIAERQEVSVQIEKLEKLEGLRLALDGVEVAKMQQYNIEASQRKISAIRNMKQHTSGEQTELALSNRVDFNHEGNGLTPQKANGDSSPGTSRFSWIKRIFKNSPEKHITKQEGGESLMGTNGSTLHSGSARSLPVGKKRRVEKIHFEDHVDEESGEKLLNKRRKQEEHVAAIFPEQTSTHCVTSTEARLPDDESAANGGAEDSNVVIVKEVTKISEVTYEMTDMENLASLEQIECLLNREAMPENLIYEVGGTNGHTSSKHTEEATELSSRLDAPEIITEINVGNHEPSSKQIQVQSSVAASEDAGQSTTSEQNL